MNTGLIYTSSDTGRQLQNRFRSPYTLSTRPTGGQYLMAPVAAGRPVLAAPTARG